MSRRLSHGQEEDEHYLWRKELKRSFLFALANLFSDLRSLHSFSERNCKTKQNSLANVAHFPELKLNLYFAKMNKLNQYSKLSP